MSIFVEEIIKFAQSSRSDAFIRDEKKICSVLQSALGTVYQDDGDEVKLVERTIAALNATPGGHFKLESLFIHGNRSIVAFDYYGKVAKKELGDLMVVSTLTSGGTPILQKLTIVQAKRDTSKPFTWVIDREQLFFLSNWPEFQGVMGIFPKGEVSIPDYSGCLGSYYLYREPGDFAFISAKELEKSLGSKKRITFDELLTTQTETGHFHGLRGGLLTGPFPFMDPEKAYHYFKECCYLFMRRGLVPPFGFPWGDSTFQVLRNVHFAKNVNDTIADFSRLNVGEPVFAFDSAMPVNEFAYRLLNTVIRYAVRTQEGRLGHLMEFNAEAPFFEEADLSGVRIGLLHMITEVTVG